MNTNIYLTCPIRGILKEKKYDSKGNYTEEYWRIELIKFLLGKGYLSKEILIGYKVKLGSKKKDKLIADIFVDCAPYIVCEVKKNSKSKKDAVETQLKPAMNLTQADYGIYFDGSSNELHYKKGIYSINKLPKKGYSWEQISLNFDDLRKITNVNSLYKNLDQTMHSYGVGTKERYKGLFQILIAKYFDEKFNKDKKELLFQVSSNSVQTDLERINNLYKKAKTVYYADSPVELGEDLILNDDVVINIAKHLQEYSFLKSDISAVQAFFMKFGKELLEKKDLSQYYTPLSVVKFIANILKIEASDLVIDPAGGSADFLVGILEKYKESSQYNEYSKNLFYWDTSPEAHNVARINMILHGDGRSKMSMLDSIENYDKMNGKFDFVITNPPFGKETVWKKDKKLLKKNGKEVYSLVVYNRDYYLGVLFIERSINLLKEDGILVIILPSGYLNNQSLKYIREYLLKYRIVADISLPQGTFRGADTGVKTEILIVKKQQHSVGDYKIFVSSPKKLGFNYHRQDLAPVYKIDENSGEYLQDSKNENILDDELNETVIKKFKKFCCDENLERFEQCKVEEKCNSESEVYDFLTLAELKKEENLKLKPELFLTSFRKHINKLKILKWVTLRELWDKGEKISVEKNTSIEIEDSLNYRYINIGSSSSGDYSLDNLKKGWEIKKITRANQPVDKNDICLSYLLGSKDKFFIMLEDETDNIVITTGFYRIKINNERIRLSFYAFLFSKSFEIQFEAYATGHIQTNIVPERVWDFRFPLLSEEETQSWKGYIMKVEKTKKEFKSLLEKIIIDC